MKIAISVPDEVFEAGEHLAQQLGLSRSRLHSDALSSYLGEYSAAAITAKLNAIYAGESSKPDPAFTGLQFTNLANETLPMKPRQ